MMTRQSHQVALSTPRCCTFPPVLPFNQPDIPKQLYPHPQHPHMPHVTCAHTFNTLQLVSTTHMHKHHPIHRPRRGLLLSAA